MMMPSAMMIMMIAMMMTERQIGCQILFDVILTYIYLYLLCSLLTSHSNIISGFHKYAPKRSISPSKMYCRGVWDLWDVSSPSGLDDDRAKSKIAKQRFIGTGLVRRTKNDIF